MYRQTLCFIQRNDELLMLNREPTPAQGLWNGVGGTMEAGETPLECVIREVMEETGIDIGSYPIANKGTVSWEVDHAFTGGFHVYLIAVENQYEYKTPKKIDKGILDWKKIDWLLEEKIMA